MASIPILVVTGSGAALPGAITGAGVAVTILDNDGNVVIEVSNPTAGPLNLSVARTATVAGEALDPKVVAVEAGATEWFGPYAPFLYNAPDNSVAVTPDAGLELRGLRF
jgi:hypothetical protein